MKKHGFPTLILTIKNYIAYMWLIQLRTNTLIVHSVCEYKSKKYTFSESTGFILFRGYKHLFANICKQHF